ncbi:MAG TPA: MFS transporter [Casimicrobiaceae bacterium]|nr:MFS transporter [Casimicrobiaceae bacterium]
MDTTTRFPVAAVAATSLGFALVQLDVTIVNVALPRIFADLAASISALQWIVDAYTLSFAALLLTAGALGDRLGARATYIAGFGIFALASAMCGLAPDARSLIAARALQGLGAALLVPSSLALLDAACGGDKVRRARGVAFWTASGGMSIAAGPLLGALLVDTLGWRWIFFLNVPVCVLAALAVIRLKMPSPSHSNSARGYDPLGQILAVVALAALVATIIEASAATVDPAFIVGGSIVALLATLGFCIVESRAATPMLPLVFFTRPGFSRAMLFGVIVNFTYYGIVFALSLYLQQARGYSPLDAGLAYLPLTATFIVSNVMSGSVMARYGTRVPMIVGAVIGACGFTLLLRLEDASTFLSMLPPFALIPFGMGLAVPAMTTLMLSSLERRFAATASGALNAARQAGGALGVAVFGALVAHDPIIGGLHQAAFMSAALMVIAAVIAVARKQAIDRLGREGLRTRAPSPSMKPAPWMRVTTERRVHFSE